MTPEMLEIVMPMLGYSIMLNILLAAMLLFRPLARLVSRFITTYWMGVQLMIRN